MSVLALSGLFEEARYASAIGWKADIPQRSAVYEYTP
jgi:hypothetical protein